MQRWTPLLLVTMALFGCGDDTAESNTTQSPCGDIFTDARHCGTCDNICPITATCVLDACTCDTGQDICDDACVDLQADDQNCGACGEVCASGRACVDGQCQCEGDSQMCLGRCLDVTTHAEHCGGCGNVCPTGSRCTGSECVCRPGLEICGDRCTDVIDDPANCGACGVVCGEGLVCFEGACQCPSGAQEECGGACVNVARSTDHCGACDRICPGGASCQNGDCRCPSLLSDVCDDQCVSTNDDPSNCGECGEVCLSDQQCVQGRCVCPFGREVCNGRCVSTAVDPTHCGACNRPCETGQRCCNGTCADECEIPPFDLDCPEQTLIEANGGPRGLDLHELRFEISDQTSSYVVVPYNTEGNVVAGLELVGPAGSLDLEGDYAFAGINSILLGDIAPVMVPQAPQFAGVVGPGEHALTVGTRGDLCRAVVASTGIGTRLTLRVYIVGVGGLDAEGAPSNASLQAVLDESREILSPLGVSLEVSEYVDLDGAAEQRFQVIRNEFDIHGLVATSTSPGEGIDERMVLNLFLVHQFAIPGGNLLGVSAGIPGAPGMHGTRGSGVIVADLLSDPVLMAQVVVHEIGHFLGLFHTSEIGGRGFDPLGDTTTCAANVWSNPGRCPDINNLMFPFINPAGRGVTNDQASVLRANPLVR